MAKKANYTKKDNKTNIKKSGQQAAGKNKADIKAAESKQKGKQAGHAKAKQTQKEKPLHWVYMLPVVLVLAVIPLITLYKKYKTNLVDFDWFTPAGEGPEFFLYYKMWALIAVGVFILVLIIARYVFYEEKIAWEKTMIPLAIYTVLVILSTVFSPYKEYSLKGSYEQFEPVWVLVTYSLITYYCYMSVNSEVRTKKAVKWLLIGVSIMCLLGLSQVIKQDFFRTDLGQNIITGPKYDIYTDGKLLFNFELGRVYATLYNPNYVGSYVVLFVPLLLALITYAKKWSERITYLIITLALLACLFGSQSRAGIIGIVVSLIALAVFERKYLIKNWKVTVGALVLLIAAFVGVDTINGHVLSNRLKEIVAPSQPEYYALRNIYTNDEDVTVDYNGNMLHVSWIYDEASASYQYTILDAEGAIVVSTVDENGYIWLADERFTGISIYTVALTEGVNGFAIVVDENLEDAIPGQPWYFTDKYPEISGYCIYSATGRFMKLSQPEGTPYLEEHYHAFNMRGYIWSKTIPLLKKYFFLGSGADTFVIAFPNDDLVGMYNSGHVNEIITRPHCWYLQMGVTTGVLSLICFLVFYLMYVVGSIRLYWKMEESNYLAKIGVAILCASVGYMVVAIINDSIVCVAPIYWALLGIGLAINAKLRKERKAEIKGE